MTAPPPLLNADDFRAYLDSRFDALGHTFDEYVAAHDKQHDLERQVRERERVLADLQVSRLEKVAEDVATLKVSVGEIVARHGAIIVAVGVGGGFVGTALGLFFQIMMQGVLHK